MPPQATKDWLSILNEKAQEREIYVDMNINGRIFHFHLGRDPGIIGKVRYSAAKSRDYENEQGQKHIWHRYNREKEMIDQGSKRKVVNITLDVWDKNEYDPNDHHFIFLTERLIREETYSQGDQKIWIEGDGHYSGPLAEYVDDWDAIFEYATGTSSPSPSTPSSDGFGSDADVTELPNGSKTTERRSTTRNDVIRNDELVQTLKTLYDHTCQICGDRRLQGLDSGFSHVHHLMPLGKPHNGPDVPENVIVVCPNHHEDFENGMLTVDPQTLEVDHFYEEVPTGRTIETKGEHKIGPQYVAYHNQVVALSEV
ncbi:HNH endonuclease [Halomontanus rarus]|uniref:HNH endonuclease n=1 Tax=Halomontanus rarus TaxID=3034020 RepID=UPI0023E77D66|nr:HNH endonuclease [Halovivax sp. TS33]